MSEVRPLRHFTYGALVLLAVAGACTRTTPAPAPEPEAKTPTAAAAAPVPMADPYHPAPRDTVEIALYRAWQQYQLQCARCHGEDAQGSTFGPSLLVGLRPDGNVPTRDQFLDVLVHGRKDKGMPDITKTGVDSVHFDGLYRYLKGRSDGALHGGRPARRES
jgi:mono/diheme cytochrome c family protein